MTKLILMRHGQSIWNARNLFTGWVDVDLSQVGITEAIQGGKQISHLPIDEVHTSALIRAQRTALLALGEHGSDSTPVFHFEKPEESAEREEQLLLEWAQISEKTSKAGVGGNTPVYVTWKLNERMYGDLQGLDKQDTRDKYGDEQVHIWRRSFDTPPPNGESLEMTAARTIPYFSEVILPSLRSGNNIFVAAHGNSLRSIIMHIDGLSREQVLSLEVPTGVPIVYDLLNGELSQS